MYFQIQSLEKEAINKINLKKQTNISNDDEF